MLKHSIEITEEAFRLLIASKTYGQSVAESTEHAQLHYYNAHGMQLLSVYNYLSQVIQYYAQDINA